MSPAELRVWYTDLANRHFAEPILGRYKVQLVDRATWKASFNAVTDNVFPGDANMDIHRAWTEAQRARFDELNAIFGEPLDHNAILVDPEHGDAPVAWAYGVQDQRATFYMAITGVHPNWRGRGIYPAYLDRLLGFLREVGFREVVSRHQADNNGVLIPKLRAGFKISAFEITPNYGLLVHLRYNFSEDMRAVYAWRVDGRVGADHLRARGILK